jgi:hypothetical protein
MNGGKNEMSVTGSSLPILPIVKERKHVRLTGFEDQIKLKGEQLALGYQHSPVPPVAKSSGVYRPHHVRHLTTDSVTKPNVSEREIKRMRQPNSDPLDGNRVMESVDKTEEDVRSGMLRSKQDVTLRPYPKKLKRKKEVRKLEGNYEIIEEINGYIDKMNEFLAYKTMFSKLNHCSTSKLVKEFFKVKELQDSKTLLDKDTPYGNILVRSEISLTGKSIRVVNEALIKIGQDPNRLELRTREYNDKLTINTDEIKGSDAYVGKMKDLEKILREYKSICKDGMNNTDDDELTDKRYFPGATNAIAVNFASKRWLSQEIIGQMREYSINYNLLKNKYKEVSTEGEFPRDHHYNGVSLSWGHTSTLSSYYLNVVDHLDNLDLKDGTNLKIMFNNAMEEINIMEKKYKLKIMLDGYDYETDDSDYEN